MTDANSIEIFSILDEFCKYFAPELGKHTLDTSGKRRRNRLCLMSDSEAMTILVLFHIMRHCDLKSFYLAYVCNHMRKEFPHRLSYNRLVERQAKVGLQLLRFLQICALDIHYRPHSIGVLPPHSALKLPVRRSMPTRIRLPANVKVSARQTCWA